ncbi:PA0069 family radical SAM protein [Benzoatithermus flavus]|uniref:PA0069 family radical SAM protein n=1 Tax=Benzoatithermus flavus TaxID=3108223 RepID=A0ABU8XPS6_9PROT
MLPRAHKGRGATCNPEGRYERHAREAFDDGWGSLDELAMEPSPRTEALPDRARTIITHNQSPDVPFDQSINPYRGCEHGCIYCYARPTHAFLGLSPGLDFETRIFVKQDAARLLRQELAQPGYRCRPISLGANTDPYQPLERRLRVTRAILEVLAEARHPVGIVTKSALVCRDLDLLAPMARDGLANVHLSLTTLDPKIARTLEPRASSPQRRLMAMRTLAEAGVPVGVMVAPIIPGLTDAEIEAILEQAAAAGASTAGRVLLRLPYEVKDLFAGWLEAHFPLRARHVLSLVRQCRGGRLNDPDFGSRMRGQGAFAELIAQRFRKAVRRLGLDRRALPQRTDLFRRPTADGQLSLL